MYIDTKGMGLRGLGAAENPDINVYDADGNVVSGDATTTWGGRSGGTFPNPTVQTIATNWLNNHATTLMIGGAAVFGFLLLRKASR